MQRRSNRRRDQRRERTRKATAERRSARKAVHPLHRARAAARIADEHLEAMVSAITAAGKANDWDRRGFSFLTVMTHGSLDDARSHADAARRALETLTADLRDLSAAHEDELRGILGRLEMDSNWELIVAGTGSSWIQDAYVGRKIDRMRVKAKAARVHLGKLRRTLDTLAGEMGLAG